MAWVADAANRGGVRYPPSGWEDTGPRARCTHGGGGAQHRQRATVCA